MRASIAFAATLLLATPAASSDKVIATRTLRVGSILAETDLSRPSSDLVGMEVRRAVYAGHSIGPEDVGPPTLVRRNEIVRMHFAAGRIDLRTEGRALGAGGAGETIEVMNLSSRQTVRARVVGTRRVEVRR